MKYNMDLKIFKNQLNQLLLILLKGRIKHRRLTALLNIIKPYVL